VLDLTSTRPHQHTSATARPPTTSHAIAPARETLPIAPRRSRRGAWAIAALVAASGGGVLAWTQWPAQADPQAASLHPAPAPAGEPAVTQASNPPPPAPSETRAVTPPVAAPIHDEPKPRNPPRAHRPVDLLAGCHSRSLSPSAAACTLAACQAHDRAAVAWLAHVPASKRATIAAQCASAGMTIVTPDVTPATASKTCDDPMECRK
jgi:hypothetical protein